MKRLLLIAAFLVPFLAISKNTYKIHRYEKQTVDGVTSIFLAVSVYNGEKVAYVEYFLTPEEGALVQTNEDNIEAVLNKLISDAGQKLVADSVQKNIVFMDESKRAFLESKVK